MPETLSVLIPDGESSLALFVAHCLSSVDNVEVHVLSAERWSALRFSRYCRSYTFTPHGYDDGRFLDAIAGTVKRHGVQVLLPADTSAIPFAIAHRADLCQFVAVAPLPEQRVFETANNKWLMAQFLAANDIATPPCLLIDYSEGFFGKLRDMQFPVLIKPTALRGGDGIRQFDNFDELTVFLGAEHERVKDQFIVQTLLAGIDVSLNVLARDGRILAMTVQQGMIPNTQKFGGPGALQFVDDPRFTLVAERLVAALHWSGYACVDTLCDARSNLHILDINARFWASVRGSWVAGVNIPYLACLAALNIGFSRPDIPTTRFYHQKTAVREFVSSWLRSRARRGPGPNETDLKFLMVDPLAETLRIFYQEILDK